MPGGSTIGSRLIFVANEKLIISIEKFVYLKKKSVDKFETIEIHINRYLRLSLLLRSICRPQM